MLDRAIAFDVPLGCADAIHVASALLIGVDEVTVATHDRQMLASVGKLGFRVHDPAGLR